MLLKRGYGAEVDLHDVVMRSKHQPVHDYQALVGTRTNYRIMNEEYSRR
jgi:hypothetical protein